MKRRLLTSIIIFFIVLTSSTHALVSDTITLKRAGNKMASVSNPYGFLWEYSENGKTWEITSSDNGKVVFKKGYDTLAEGTFNGSKLMMESSPDEFYLFVRLSADTVEVNWNKTDNQWTLEQDENKIKAKYNEMDYGKIRLKPDTQKLKVKDRFDKAIVEIKPCEKLYFAPGAFLMNELSEDQQIFLTLLLFSKNQ